MSCERFRVDVHEIYREQVDRDLLRSVEEHAAACPACAEYRRACEEIACREVVEALDDYVDGELSPGRRATFESHLDLCTDCAAYLEAYRRTIALSGEALREASTPDAALSEALVRAVLDARRAETEP